LFENAIYPKKKEMSKKSKVKNEKNEKIILKGKN